MEEYCKNQSGCRGGKLMIKNYDKLLAFSQGWTIWNVGTNIKPKYQVQRIDVPEDNPNCDLINPIDSDDVAIQLAKQMGIECDEDGYVDATI